MYLGFYVAKYRCTHSKPKSRIHLPILDQSARAFGHNPEFTNLDIVNWWWHDKFPDFKDTDSIEMPAFLGHFVLSSTFRLTHENLLPLFSTNTTGYFILRVVVSARIIKKFLISFRFDDPDTRKVRKLTDGPSTPFHFYLKINWNHFPKSW